MSETITNAQTKRSMAAAMKTWHYFLLPDTQQAVDFANLDPAQGAGEAEFCRRDDGQVDTFLFF